MILRSYESKKIVKVAQIHTIRTNCDKYHLLAGSKKKHQEKQRKEVGLVATTV